MDKQSELWSSLATYQTELQSSFATKKAIRYTKVFKSIFIKSIMKLLKIKIFLAGTIM